MSPAEFAWDLYVLFWVILFAALGVAAVVVLTFRLIGNFVDARYYKARYSTTRRELATERNTSAALRTRLADTTQLLIAAEESINQCPPGSPKGDEVYDQVADSHFVLWEREVESA